MVSKLDVRNAGNERRLKTTTSVFSRLNVKQGFLSVVSTTIVRRGGRRRSWCNMAWLVSPLMVRTGEGDRREGQLSGRMMRQLP